MKQALVTGGNRGIGFEICRGLSKKGIKVFLGSRSKALGEEAAEQLQKEGEKVVPITLNVSNPRSIQQAAAQILNEYGSLDILINNAAILPEGSLIEVEEKLILEGVETNLLGPIYCIRAFLPSMIEKGYGRIVNVSSGWGSFHEGLQGPAIYSITKAALNAITLNTALHLPQNVKINSLCPGWVRTRMGGPSALRSVEEGADTAIWLATLPDNGPSGKFFRDRQEIAW